MLRTFNHLITAASYSEGRNTRHFRHLPCGRDPIFSNRSDLHWDTGTGTNESRSCAFNSCVDGRHKLNKVIKQGSIIIQFFEESLTYWHSVRHLITSMKPLISFQTSAQQFATFWMPRLSFLWTKKFTWMNLKQASSFCKRTNLN